MFNVACPCNCRLKYHEQKRYLELLSYDTRADMVLQLRTQGLSNVCWFAEFRYLADRPCFFLGVQSRAPNTQPTISQQLAAAILVDFHLGINDWLPPTIHRAAQRAAQDVSDDYVEY